MITAAQLRAARGLLDWSRSDLSKASNISPETIKNIEHGTFKPQEMTADAIVKAFAAQGVEFTEGEGVRLVRDSVVRYEGANGFKKLLDDIYEEARKPYSTKGGEKPICASNFNDKLFVDHLGDFVSYHVERMSKIPNLLIRILVQNNGLKTSSANKSSGFSVSDVKYREGRIPSGEHDGDTPFYVFGDKLGILVLEPNQEAKIFVIASAPVARSYRQHFEAIWNNAKRIEDR